MKKTNINKDKLIHCETFEDFITKFKSIFELKRKQIILAPVRLSKNFQFDHFMFQTLLQEKKKIVIFLSEKNVESYYSRVSFLLKKEGLDYKNKLLMFNKRTSNSNMKKIESFLEKNSQENVGILARFCYFSDQEKSELFRKYCY